MTRHWSDTGGFHVEFEWVYSKVWWCLLVPTTIDL